MEAFDTNVLVRLLVRDDEEQCARAEAALRNALSRGGVWLSLVVIAEIAWVLRGAYKLDRSEIAAALRRLLDTEGMSPESEGAVRAALAQFETGACDLADYLILELARSAGALPVRTFDEQLADADGAALVPPIVSP